MLSLLDQRWGECQLCKWLRNPYYAPAAYLARFSVNLATVVWSMIVIIVDEALSPLYIHHKQMLALMPEDYWAWLGMIAAGFGMYRLIHKTKPRWWGGVGYTILMIFWVYVDAATILVDRTLASPSSVAGITTVAFLSIFAAASHARHNREPV